MQTEPVTLEDLAEEKLSKEVLKAIQNLEFKFEVTVSPNHLKVTTGLQGKYLIALLLALIGGYLKIR